MRRSSLARRPYDIDSLTDVALHVFAEHGYHAASMDDVARAAGITKASIYHHVAGKEALLDRGLTRALDALFAILDEPKASQGPATAQLRYLLGRVVEVTLARRPELTILFRIRANSEPERRAQERRREFNARVAELIAEAQRAEALRRDIDPRLAARLIFGMSNSIVEWYREDRALGSEDIATAITTVAFEGLSHA